MSTEEETNARCQLSMENGIDENGNSHRRLNKYALASVMAASIISAVFGYGELLTFSILVFILIYSLFELKNKMEREKI